MQKSFQQRIERLEALIEQHCDPSAWYTFVLVLRLQEDKVMRRVPALFRSRRDHFRGYITPLVAMNVVLGMACWLHRSDGWINMLLLNSMLAPLYIWIAQWDWNCLRALQKRLKLPNQWDQYGITVDTVAD